MKVTWTVKNLANCNLTKYIYFFYKNIKYKSIAFVPKQDSITN